jgi:hypothetical protein
MSDDSSSEGEAECPLCLEELDVTEKNFHPCKCGYQVCLWCWHNINEKLNGKCPACRADYDPEGAYSNIFLVFPRLQLFGWLGPSEVTLVLFACSHPGLIYRAREEGGTLLISFSLLHRLLVHGTEASRVK